MGTDLRKIHRCLSDCVCQARAHRLHPPYHFDISPSAAAAAAAAASTYASDEVKWAFAASGGEGGGGGGRGRHYKACDEGDDVNDRQAAALW